MLSKKRNLANLNIATILPQFKNFVFLIKYIYQKSVYELKKKGSYVIIKISKYNGVV